MDLSSVANFLNNQCLGYCPSQDVKWLVDTEDVLNGMPICH